MKGEKQNMNKLFTKIAKIFLGLSMAAGVGVAVGSNREASKVDASAASAAAGTYNLITDLNDLTADSTVIFINQEGTYACKPYSSGNNMGRQSVSASDGTLTLASANANIASWTVKINSSGKFGFHNGDGYLKSNSTSKNYITISSTVANTAPSGVEAWTITISDAGVATIQNVTNTSYYLKYNSGGYFSQYSSNQAHFCIYKKASAKTLSSIAVTTPPTTTSYYVGQSFSSTGMVVTATYSDASTANVTSSCTFTPDPFTTTGSQNVTVSYTEGGVTKTATQQVTVNAARTKTGIELNGTISKDEYYVGDTWDLTGLNIKVNWSAGDPTYVELNDENVVYACTPATATSTSITEFEIEVLYDNFDETFTVDGLTVSEKPFKDVLTDSVIGTQSATYTSSWAVISDIEDYTGAKYLIRTMKPSAGSGYTMQTNANGYMVTTACPSNSRVKSISFSFLTNGKNLAIYGSNTAYASDAAPSETSLGTVSGNGGEVSFDFTSLENSYKYVAFKGTASSTTIGTITIEYEKGPFKLNAPGQPTYSSVNQRLTWAAVTNASSYQYTTNGGESWTNVTDSSNRYIDVSEWTNNESYTVALRAVGDGTNYATSDPGTSLTFTKVSAAEYTSVTVTSGNLVGDTKGTAYIQCSASATGTNLPQNPTFSWYITTTSTFAETSSIENKASIDSTGKIIFLDDCTLYVWALAPDGETHNTVNCVVTASNLKDPKGSLANPYSVAEALSAITSGTGVNDVYVEGIVSSIHTDYSTQYLNVSFNMSDDGLTSSDQLLAYREKSSYSSTVKATDKVIVHGNLIDYQGTKELAQNCAIVSLTEKTITNLTLSGNYQTAFNTGDTFNHDNMVVTANYSDSTSADVTSSATFTGYDMSTAGQQTVTVSFGTASTTYQITVTKVPTLNDISISPTLSIEIEETKTLTVTVDADQGVTPTLTVSDGGSSLIDVSIDGTTVTVEAGTTAGNATITVTGTYGNVQKTAECVVTVVDPNQLTQTWDLTTNSYSSSSADAVVWSATGISATSTKVSGSTAANNYVPTPENGYNHTRFLYSGHTLTFKPETSYSISSIQITLTTENYAETVAGLSWDNATASSSGTVVTITPTDGTLTVSANGSSAVRATKIYVEFSRDLTTKLLAITDTSLVVGVDASISTTLVETNFSGGTYEVDTDECASVSISGTTVTVTGLEAGSYTFTISETTYDLDVELTVTVYDPSLYYSKLNSSSDIVTGDRFIIKASSYDEALGGISSSVGQPVDIESNVKNDGANIDSYNLSEDVHIFTLISSGNANKYYLYDITGEYFLVGSSTATTTSTSATLSGATEWTITISSGVATITVGERSLMYNYNNGNGRFACYSNNMTSLNLYRISGSSLKDHLNTFENNSLKMDSYDVGGEHGSTGGNGSCESYYLPAKAAFNDLSEAEQQLFITSSEYSAAKQRYEDWAIANKDGAPYDGNDDVQTQLSANILSTIIGSNSNAVAIIVIISMVSMTAIGGYFFLKKRKEN